MRSSPSTDRTRIHSSLTFHRRRRHVHVVERQQRLRHLEAADVLRPASCHSSGRECECGNWCWPGVRRVRGVDWPERWRRREDSQWRRSRCGIGCCLQRQHEWNRTPNHRLPTQEDTTPAPRARIRIRQLARVQEEAGQRRTACARTTASLCFLMVRRPPRRGGTSRS